MRYMIAVMVPALVVGVVASAPRPRPMAPTTFLVEEGGRLRVLGPDGTEKETLDPPAGCAALSPDGRRLAAVEFDRGRNCCVLSIRPRGEAGEAVTVPLLWGQPGQSGCLPVWSADGARLLIGENRPRPAGAVEYAHRVYDLASGKAVEVKLPAGCWVTGWSADGKRFLATVAQGDGSSRLAWVAADGTGKPEFLTGGEEIAGYGRLSPDGKRVLCTVGPKTPKGPDDHPRLTVIEVSSGKRTVVDEPGHTYGHCWSADGSKVAYTWQRPLADPPPTERETLLITCTPEGRDRKVVTTRKYSPTSPAAGVVYFFSVVAWW